MANYPPAKNDDKLVINLSEALKPIPPKSAVDSKMASAFGKKVANKRTKA